LTELEKLQKAVELIETVSNGGYEFSGCEIGTPYISCTYDSQKLGLQFVLNRNFETQRYELRFAANIREMGRALDAEDMKNLRDEIWRVNALIAALETETYAPNEDEYNRFKDWLVQREEQSMQNIPRLGM
jgi:hypothetical protein